ncbi:MAG: leucine-rich repeat protein [Mycoplasma sp.]|nr:leucine-rich repeat protein [Candidatus Hennigella equi]
MNKFKLINGACIAAVGLGAIIPPVCIQCVNSQKELFNITDGILYGFNKSLSQKQINKLLEGQDTLTIPSYVTRIMPQAFFNPNGDYDVESYSFIPSNIKTLDLSKVNNLAFVGKQAFYCAPFENIIFPHDISVVEDYAFGYCVNLNYIDLSQYNNFPLVGWSSLAWNFGHAKSGVILVQNEIAKIEWQYYFSVNNDFVFGSGHWVIDVLSFSKVFNLNGDTVEGFSDEFLKASDFQKREFIRSISGDDSVLSFPIYTNGQIIKKILPNAFYNEQTDSSTIPSWVNELYFSDEQKIASIGSKAFKKAPFKQIILNNDINEVGELAFQDCPNLLYIDASDLHFVPENWSTVDGTWSTQSIYNGTIKIKIPNYKETIFDYFRKCGLNNWSEEVSYNQPLNIYHNLLLGFYYPELSEKEISLLLDPQDTRDVQLTIPREVVAINDRAFAIVSHPTYWSTIPTCVKRVSFEDDSMCDYIGLEAFLDAKFEHINLPNQLITIGDMAFMHCRNLIDINFPASLVEVGNLGFYGCNTLTSIKLPTTLQSIGLQAFRSCYKIKNIDISDFPTDCTSVPVGWSKMDVFTDLCQDSGCTITVAKGTTETTKAMWKEYFITASDSTMIFDSDHWKIVEQQ